MVTFITEQLETKIFLLLYSYTCRSKASTVKLAELDFSTIVTATTKHDVLHYLNRIASIHLRLQELGFLSNSVHHV